MRARQTRPSRLARPGQLPAAHRPTSAQSRQTNSEPWATPFSQTPAVERITLEPSRANTGRTKGSIGLRGRCEVASGRCEVVAGRCELASGRCEVVAGRCEGCELTSRSVRRVRGNSFEIEAFRADG